MRNETMTEKKEMTTRDPIRRIEWNGCIKAIARAKKILVYIRIMVWGGYLFKDLVPSILLEEQNAIEPTTPRS
jgi:hypothetical protein